MTTVLDSFVIEFGLDHRPMEKSEQELVDFLRKSNEQALGQANEIESHVKKSFDLISNMRREALTVLTLFFGGKEIGEFVRHITSLDAATGRLAITLGMSAQETSAWGGAIKQNGGTIEGANSALSGLSSEMSRFQLTGQSSMLPVLSRLGISLYDGNRNLKTAGQLWLELSAAVQGMNAREATAFLQMIPGATQDMINFALLGPQKMQEYIRASRAAGVTTAESAAAARDYQRAVQQLDQSSQNLGRTLVTMVAPAISTVTESLAKLLQSWQTKRGGPEDVRRDSTQRAELVSRFGSPGDFIRSIATPKDGSKPWGLDAWLLRKADEWYGPAGADSDSAKHTLMKNMRQFSGPNTGNTNWDNFLQGLSFLETDQRNIGNSTTTAQGYFQFLKGTAEKARTAGIQDPRAGTYQDQASSTQAYIKRFYPEAATAIDKGDYGRATVLLRGEWPSLPGGSQPQSASRYAAFSRYLAGERPGAAGGTKSVTVNVGGVTVNSAAGNADGIAKDIDGALRRSVTAGAANYGAQ